jgi:hypothetical protein
VPSRPNAERGTELAEVPRYDTRLQPSSLSVICRDTPSALSSFHRTQSHTTHCHWAANSQHGSRGPDNLCCKSRCLTDDMMQSLTPGRFLVCRDHHNTHMLHPNNHSLARPIRRECASREAHCLSPVEEPHPRRSRRISCTRRRRRPQPARSSTTDIRTTQLCIQQASAIGASIQLSTARILATAAAARVRRA